MKRFAKPFLVILGILVMIGCEKDDSLLLDEANNLKSLENFPEYKDGETVFGPETFSRTAGKPDLITSEIEIENFDQFEETFLLVIENGNEDGSNRVAAAEVKLNDEIIFTPEEFDDKPSWLFKEINILELQSLSIELRSKPETFISIHIIGINSFSGDEGTFIDQRDGIEYNWVRIGEQIWMAENLAYLPSVVGRDTESYTDPYHYVYGYNGTSVTDAKATDNYQTYGVLYNWPAALQACPTGWHLPSDAEWKELEMYLGMSQAEADDTGWYERGSGEGGKLKETGTTHWNSPNTGATNESGFTALPGGGLSTNGNFFLIGSLGTWWSATEYYTIYACRRAMLYTNSIVNRNFAGKEYGYSVRCVRD